jgi:hypothetical protein
MHYSNQQDQSSDFEAQLQKGFEFEELIVEKFYTSGFTLLEWQGNKRTKKIIPVSFKKPDLVYSCRATTKKSFFAVECKYRAKLDRNRFVLKESHFNSYMEYLKKTHMPVFIVLGVGGKSINPFEIYVIPLLALEANLSIHRNKLVDYRHNKENNYFEWCPNDSIIK